MTGKAFIFSAPSGSGKTTIVRHLLQKFPELSFSISATTRPIRGTEEHGKDYYFLSEKDFKALIQNNGLLEYEEVYKGRYYGTLIEEVERIWAGGNHVVFDVDVVGGANLKQKLADKALAVFIKVPDLDTLKTRLQARGTENDEELQKRISKAEEELSYEHRFDISLINDDLDKAFKEAEKMVSEFLDQ
jgi:guanylate kinase